jgi:hypothetical protein
MIEDKEDDFIGFVKSVTLKETKEDFERNYKILKGLINEDILENVLKIDKDEKI